jgi:hypothetical protein
VLRRVDLGMGGALVLLARQPRLLLGPTTPLGLGRQAAPLGVRGLPLTFDFRGLTLLLFLFLDRALGAAADVERLRLVGLDAQRRIAADDRRPELAGVELGDALADQRRCLCAAAGRGLGLLPGQLDLRPQVLEDASVGAIAGRLLGVRARFVEGAVNDGAAGLLDGIADPLLARPLARRLIVDRRLRALPDLARLVEARLVELGLGRGPDGGGPLAALERGAGALHHCRERHVIAGAGHGLAHDADAGVARPHLDGLGDQGVGGVDVAAAESCLRVVEVFVGVLLIERRLGPGPQLARLRVVLVDGAGPVGEIDRLLEAPGLERLRCRLEVLGDLLRAHAGQAIRIGPGPSPGLGGARRRRVRDERLQLVARVLARVVALQPATDTRQVAVHRRQIGVAPPGILLEGLGDDLLDLGVGVRDRLAQAGRRLLGDAAEDAVAEPAGKGLPITQQLEHDRADGKDVGAMIDRQALDLLRRHVVEAADQRAGVGDAGVGQLGDAEVENLQAPAALLDHQVGRLDVAVDDVEAVGVGQAVAELLEQPQLAGDGGRLLAADPHRQRLAVDVLHGDERLAVLFADVEDADDVLVLEDAGRVRLLHEAAPDLVVVDAFLEELDGDRAAADLGVAGPQEGAHPARSDRAEDLVATDRVGNCHGRRELYVC